MQIVVPALIFATLTFTTPALASLKGSIDHHARLAGFPESDYPYFSKPNGCGPGAGTLNHAIPDTVQGGRVNWRPVCNRHDLCYMTYGVDRAHCDNVFLAGMQRSCNEQLNSIAEKALLPSCHAMAQTYYGVVRQQGAWFFFENQQDAESYFFAVEGIRLRLENGQLPETLSLR